VKVADGPMKDNKAGVENFDPLIGNMVALHDRMNKRVAEFLKVRGYLGKDEMRSYETEIAGLKALPPTNQQPR
jgi:hypothetical protein